MNNLYLIKPEKEMETIMLLGNSIIKPIFTKEGDLGFIGNQEIVNNLGLDVILIHDLNELETQLISDIDSKGKSEVIYNTVTRDYLKETYDCELIIKENKIEIYIKGER